MTRKINNLTCALIVISISACGGGGHNATPASSEIAIVAGVDANHNGIRDDIDVLIEGFALNDASKKAAQQLASSVQTIITASLSASEAYNNAQELYRAQNCMASLMPDYAKYMKLIQFKTLNTELRSMAWFDFERKIGGNVFNDPEGSICK